MEFKVNGEMGGFQCNPDNFIISWKGPVFRVDPNAWNPLIVHITPQHLIVLKVMKRERGQVMDLGAEIEKYFRGITNCVTCTLQERALHS